MANMTVTVPEVRIGDVIIERDDRGRVSNRIPVKTITTPRLSTYRYVNTSLRYDDVCSVEIIRPV